MRVGIHRRVETFSISHSLLTRGLPLRGGGSEQGWHRPPGLRFQNGLAFVEHFGEFCGQPPSCLGHAVAEACGRLAGAALLLVDPAESSRGNAEFMEILALEGMRHEERLVAPLAGDGVVVQAHGGFDVARPSRDAGELEGRSGVATPFGHRIKKPLLVACGQVFPRLLAFELVDAVDSRGQDLAVDAEAVMAFHQTKEALEAFQVGHLLRMIEGPPRLRERHAEH